MIPTLYKLLIYTTVLNCNVLNCNTLFYVFKHHRPVQKIFLRGNIFKNCEKTDFIVDFIVNFAVSLKNRNCLGGRSYGCGSYDSRFYNIVSKSLFSNKLLPEE